MKATYTKACEACGKLFTSNRSHAKTCSPKCRRALSRSGGSAVDQTELKRIIKKAKSALLLFRHRDVTSNNKLAEVRQALLDVVIAIAELDPDAPRLLSSLPTVAPSCPNCGQLLIYVEVDDPIFPDLAWELHVCYHCGIQWTTDDGENFTTVERPLDPELHPEITPGQADADRGDDYSIFA